MTQIGERVFLTIYHTYVAKHMWKQAGSNGDPCFYPPVNPLSTKPPLVSMENEWDMTLGPVYLQLVDLNSFK